MRSGGLRRDETRGRAAQGLTSGDLPVADAAASRRVADRAVSDLEALDGHLEARGRELEQPRAHLGSSLTQSGPAVGHRTAARGHPFVEAVIGVGGLHADPFEGDVELFGGDARERADDALAELDLAGEHRDRPVRIDTHPRVEIGVRGERRREWVHESSRAARRTALMIRQCEPQRHRCGSSASRISVSVGFGVRSSSATAPTIIPGMQ